jgi:hypothetical protein
VCMYVCIHGSWYTQILHENELISQVLKKNWYYVKWIYMSRRENVNRFSITLTCIKQVIWQTLAYTLDYGCELHEVQGKWMPFVVGKWHATVRKFNLYHGISIHRRQFDIFVYRFHRCEPSINHDLGPVYNRIPHTFSVHVATS